MNEVRPWTWPWLIATTLSKAVLATVICLGLWGALPAAIGWQPTTVSSGSMMPRLHVGDVAVSRPIRAAPPSLGTVLLFDDPDHPGRLRLHRFVRVDDDGLLVTRGDANTSDDSSPVALTAVRGVGTLRVPWVGLPVVWVRERAWLPLALGLTALTGLTAVAAQGRRFGFPEAGADPPDDPETPGSAPDESAADADAGTSSPPQARHPARTSRTAGALGLILLCLVPALPADAAFTNRTATTNRLAAATYFSCANAMVGTGADVWYRMDETLSITTTAADASGNGSTGVYSLLGRTARATRACSRDTGTAMTFNGSSGYLSSPLFNIPAPNTLTLAIWFKTTTTRGGKLIGLGNAQTGPSSTYDRHLYMTNAGKVIFGVFPSGVVKTVASPSSYNDGDWHQTVATLSTAGIRLYVDGELVASNAAVTTGEGAGAIYLRIAYDNLDGWTSSPTSRYFAGTLDDAAAYTTALSAAEVEALYEAGS